jgi:hypothetical protein
MKSHQEITDWIETLRFLIDDNSSPGDLQVIAKITLAAFDKSLKLSDQEHQTANATLQALRALEKEITPQLVDHLHNGKRSTFDANVTQIEQLQTAWTTSQLRTKTTTRAHDLLTHKLCGGILTPHADELLLWIAKRRDSKPVLCGDVDTLPAPVQRIYKHIAPTWRSDWEPALALTTNHRLPLIYDAQWNAEYRASVAWVWTQVANGDVQKVPHQHDHRPNPPCVVLAPTRRVISLPTVPPVPTAPRSRF